MKLVMNMDINLGVIMVKISRMDFFMVADTVHSNSYRLFPVIRKDSFRGQPIFLVPKIGALQDILSVGGGLPYRQNDATVRGSVHNKAAKKPRGATNTPL